MEKNNDSIKVVLSIFSIKEFRDYQIKCFEFLLNNFDSFVCQPTGSGKSIIFQALPFLSFARENPDVTQETLLKNCHYKASIISSLLSLMQDQLNFLKNIDIRAGCLSNNKEDQQLLEISWLKIDTCTSCFFQLSLVKILH